MAKVLDKKHLIKHLESIPGNPNIGLDVLTGSGDGKNTSEFWAIDKSNIRIVDNGSNLALCTLRLKKALPERLQLKQKAFAVDSVFVDINSVINRFLERYEFDISAYSEEQYDQIISTFLFLVNDDLEEVVRLRDDLLRIFNNKELYEQYSNRYGKDFLKLDKTA